jgi:chemotaxis protein histidine kinase CheA
MPTLNDYFREEARELLAAAERSLDSLPAPDATQLHRAVRGLRGTAQMAREQRVYEVVTSFEAVTRSLADGALTWPDRLASRARDTIADLRVLLEGTEDDEQRDARARGAAARWEDAATPSDAAVRAGTASAAAADKDFHEYAAREAASIADALDQGIQQLQSNPMDREALRGILRRQRALLGAARLTEIPVVAEILRAVEDLTRVIAKLDVGVKQEWLDIYRVARDALQTTIAPLLRAETPEPSHAVSRLRHMRAELIERYGAESSEQSTGAGFDVDADSDATPSDDAAILDLGAADIVATHDDVLELGTDAVVHDASPGDAAAADGDVIVIDELAYSPEAALRRALELRDVIARGAAGDSDALAAIDELFDLIRIALA